jgi:hypothetical protein
MAVGESGHILRIASLQSEEAGWPDEQAAIRLAIKDVGEEGQWCENGLPISAVKFAICHRRYQPLRWLVVQKATSTTILEPEIRRIPTSAASSVLDLPTRGPLRIAPNPLVTLSADQTGGISQSGISFNPPSQAGPPQIAIIDQAGNWTVWDIAGNRFARNKNLRPILRNRGNIFAGAVAGAALPWTRVMACHKIFWISRSKEQNQSHTPPISPSESTNRPPLSHKPFDYRRARLDIQTDASRSELLLLSDWSALQVFDMETGKTGPRFSIVKVNKGEIIMDVQSCPISPSQVFVLTTTALLWIQIMQTSDDSGFRPVVQVSTPHYRRTRDNFASLSVSPRFDTGDAESCLVCVHSPEDHRMVMYRFSKWNADGQAHVQQYDFQSDGTIFPNNNTRLVTLALAPCPQVNKSLKASAGDIALKIHPLRSDKKRRVLLRHLGSSFVVPDGFDERKILHQTESAGKLDLPNLDIPEPRKPNISDIAPFAQRLSQYAGLGHDADAHSPERVSKTQLLETIYDFTHKGQAEGDMLYMTLYVASISRRC